MKDLEFQYVKKMESSIMCDVFFGIDRMLVECAELL